MEVPPGEEVHLGRDNTWAPRASALLAGETTVSEQHACVTCSDDGTLTVTEVPRGSSNGVKVNDRVLTPGRPEPLRDGDTVWLGPKIAFTVRDPR
ncbi:FHA domain-containing protein [Streptomyces sp. KM273126]|nr:FHA domain-containing protein [Streptomyces sp. KM273126]